MDNSKLEVQMNPDYLNEIIDSYKWIKVKYYQEEDIRNPNVEWKFAYNKLREHHRDETEFLIRTCRILAEELLKEYGKGKDKA